MKVNSFARTFNASVRRRTSLPVLFVSLLIACALSAPVGYAQSTPRSDKPDAKKLYLPPGVEKLCSIEFDKDEVRPARVEDQDLPCLKSIVETLKAHPDNKLVLVGVQDPVKDHEERDNGKERMEEDMSGKDIRWEDISMYRAVNAKWYLSTYYGIDPARIIPTTNEGRDGQEVSFYLVPGDADFLHNYLNTTRTNEDPCTVKPCYDPREEHLDAQPRDQIESAPAPKS